MHDGQTDMKIPNGTGNWQQNYTATVQDSDERGRVSKLGAPSLLLSPEQHATVDPSLLRRLGSAPRSIQKGNGTLPRAHGRGGPWALARGKVHRAPPRSSETWPRYAWGPYVRQAERRAERRGHGDARIYSRPVVSSNLDVTFRHVSRRHWLHGSLARFSVTIQLIDKVISGLTVLILKEAQLGKLDSRP